MPDFITQMAIILIPNFHLYIIYLKPEMAQKKPPKNPQKLARKILNDRLDGLNLACIKSC